MEEVFDYKCIYTLLDTSSTKPKIKHPRRSDLFLFFDIVFIDCMVSRTAKQSSKGGDFKGYAEFGVSIRDWDVKKEEGFMGKYTWQSYKHKWYDHSSQSFKEESLLRSRETRDAAEVGVFTFAFELLNNRLALRSEAMNEGKK